MVLTRIFEAGEVARGRQRQADDAALRRRIGDLADLAFIGRDRRGVDGDAALLADRRRGLASRSANRRSTLKVPIRLTWMMRTNFASG